MAARSASESFRQIVARAPDSERAGRLAAEAYAAGAVGAEERDEADGVSIIFYAPAALAEAVEQALNAVDPGCVIEAAEAVPETDWSQQWKSGLEVVVISPRLCIRPSFVASTAVPDQRELVFDPGQAFGTGGHASTRLALEWIDALGPALKGARVLDVGTGTGVLSLAAVALGAQRAVGFDTDPLATEAAARNARDNGLEARACWFTGTLDAVGGPAFDVVVANLLRREMLPLLGGIAARLRPEGRAIFAGLLDRERDVVANALEAEGLRVTGERRATDPGGESWCGLITTR